MSVLPLSPFTVRSRSREEYIGHNSREDRTSRRITRGPETHRIASKWANTRALERQRSHNTRRRGGTVGGINLYHVAIHIWNIESFVHNRATLIGHTRTALKGPTRGPNVMDTITMGGDEKYQVPIKGRVVITENRGCLRAWDTEYVRASRWDG